MQRQLGKKSSQSGLERPQKGVLHHQENVPAHKSVVALAAMHDCGFKLVRIALLIFLVWQPFQFSTTDLCAMQEHFPGEASSLSFCQLSRTFSLDLIFSAIPLANSWITVSCDCEYYLGRNNAVIRKKIYFIYVYSLTAVL